MELRGGRGYYSNRLRLFLLLRQMCQTLAHPDSAHQIQVRSLRILQSVFLHQQDPQLFQPSYPHKAGYLLA